MYACGRCRSACASCQSDQSLLSALGSIGLLVILRVHSGGSKPEIIKLFSSPGQSPGRAIVLPPASGLASAAAASALAKC